MTRQRPLRIGWQDLRAGATLAACVILIFVAFDLFIRGLLHLKGLHAPRGEFQLLRAFYELVLSCAFAFGWGWTVVNKRHPALHVRYAAWLWMTPWHAGRALPLGEPTLQLGSFLMAAMLGAFLQWHGRWTWAVAPLEAMFLGYAWAAMRPLRLARRPEWWPLFWINGALVLLLLPPHPLALLPLLTVAYVLARHGIRRSLEAFPWEDPDARSLAERRALHDKPFSQLAPAATPDPRPDRAVRYFSAAALAGWWTFCLVAQWQRLTSAKPQDFHGSITLLLGSFAAVVALWRWGTYHGFARAPISLRGRLTAGRWILPNYDRAKVAPAVVAAVGVGATMAVAFLPAAALPVAAGLLVAVVLALALLLPPTKHDWQLTGQFHFPPSHRSPPIRTAATEQAVTG